MNLYGVWVVMSKEILDNLRDRRSITMAAIYPMIGPLILGLLLSFAQQMFRPPTPGVERAMVLHVGNVERAPGLEGFLKKNNVSVAPAPPDVREAVRDSRIELAVMVPEGFLEDFSAERPAQLQLFVNATRLSTVMNISRAVDLMRRYNQTIVRQRLEARGLDSAFIQGIDIQSINVGQARSLAAFFLNMIPPFVIFTIFIGGVYLALDTTSGERERGSLEPLLTNPLARWGFMLGKVGAAFVFTMAALIIQLGAFKIVFDVVVEPDFGVTVVTDVMLFVKIFLISLPMMILAVTLQVIIASVTKSFKETQTYLGLLPLIPSIPGLVLVFVTVTAHLWTMTIPFFSQVVLISGFVRGDTVSAANIAMASGSTLLVAMILLAVAARLYSREELLFSA